MTKYVEETKAAKSISVYVILNRKGEHVATVQAHFSDGGTCIVNVRDDKAGFQYGRAGGGGYDKFTAALRGMTIDGHKMTDHCGERLPKPRGKSYFPNTYKPRKGYRLANGASFMVETGERVNAYDWRDKALDQWRAETGASPDAYPQGDAWETVQRNARIMACDAAKAGIVEWGYSDCYKESGLDYLKALGYRVIKGI